MAKKKYEGDLVSNDYYKFGEDPGEDREDGDDAKYTLELAGVIKSKNFNRNGSGSFKMELEDETVVKFSGTVDLDDKMELIEVGEDVQIKLVGSRKADVKGHSPTKLFEVRRA